MIKKIEILVIDLIDRFIGLDCSEVKKVIPNASKEENLALINKYTKNKRFYRMGELLNSREIIDYNTLIVLEGEDKKDFLILVPTISNIISVNASDMMIIPEFIKAKQKPLFVWGFFKNNDNLISIITFAFFSTRGLI
jgi:hypothetical protein